MKRAFRNVITLLAIVAMGIFQNTISFASSGNVMSGVNELASEAYGYLQAVGSVLAIAVLAVYGIRWFFANSRDRAALQGKAWAYILGALLVFAGTYIGKWIISILEIIIIYPT